MKPSRTPRALMVPALAVALVLLVGAGCSRRDPLPPGLAGVGELPVPASAWPAAGYDARHSSATTVVGPRTGTVSWRVDLGGNATPGPVIGVDGSVLAATNAGVLFALSPHDGHRLWSFDGGGGYGNDLTTSPAVLGDGTILWPGPGQTLFALDRSGRPLWETEFSAMVLSPAIGGRDRVYVADMAGRLSALEISTAGHRVVWSVEVGGPDYASPTIGPDGTIFTASGQDLVAVRDLGERGVVRWRHRTESLIEVSNAVSPTGVVVVGTNDDQQLGINSEGRKVWGYDKDEWTYSSSVVRPDGTAYFGDNQGRLTVLASGSGRQVQRTQGDREPRTSGIWSAPVVDAAGGYYFATRSGVVYGFGPDAEQMFAVQVGAAVNSSPALGADGTLYLGTEAGSLIAIGPG